ncbi:MAG: FkbM family methyltransferase [Bacteroidota bacterium]
MKKLIQAILQRILGFRNYLFVFSLYKSKTITHDRNEGDFSHFLSLIKPNAVVLDIGANIGIMTSNLAQKVTQGKVYAFEPMPDNVITLKRVLSFYRLTNVTLFECALGNEAKETQMVLPVVQAVKMQGLAHVIDKSITEFNEGITFSVPQYRLDDIPELQDTPVHAIKIDVENFEYQVFLGAQQLIRTFKPIIYCELWDNENRKQCFALMQQLEYQTYVLIHNTLVLFDNTQHKTQNFFFLPRG